MIDTHSPLYKKAFEQYLRRGTPIDISIKALTAQERPTSHYIWRTAGDDKVRSSHAANNGRIFAWDNPPATGHPGEDYGCRCVAEPYNSGQGEYANQVLIAAEADNADRWTDLDFSLHFYLGEGRGLSLSQVGHLDGIMNYYLHTLGKYNSVNSQIVETVRSHEGPFGYYFGSAYEFKPYLYVFGGGTVRGVFAGNVRREASMMYITGEIDYFYNDTFTDPLSVRELLRNTSDPHDATALQVRLSDFGGKQFPVRGFWKTRFTGQALLNRAGSLYQANL
jgi:hypothetical protein